ncbi:MAG TPA: sn-glycerol-3-phosphate ABC transporter ATP-binding protein UgpC [Gaiellaceae bacterium]|nr:sn-glycerol-3-phosphate ABC transporter ATP-binding protein UgpC [Gaiellaceae bacterium]
MAAITLEHVTKAFVGGVVAVDDVNLTIEDGEFMVLVGPSGCGKSTLLRMIAGLEEITDGTISIGDRDVTELPPPERDIAMVFQNYALYPHMNVRENLGFGLSVRHTPKPEIRRRVGEVATLLGLEQLLDRKPAHLSGGQRQRVAMGRAIIREPVAFLMDEPLSNLDAKLRVGMRASLAELHARLSVTSIYVTHDQTEAMTLGHRVAVMRDGRVVQVDVPQRLYQSPNDLFVAAFIGSPSMNLVEATVDGDGITFGQFRVPLDLARRPPRGVDRVVLGVRPESFDDAAFAQAHWPRLEVTVDVLEELGSDSHVFFRVAAPRVTIETRNAPDDETTILAEHDSRFTARVNPATRAGVGSPLELAVNPASFHFFDVRTGESLLLADAGREPAHEEALP